MKKAVHLCMTCMNKGTCKMKFLETAEVLACPFYKKQEKNPYELREEKIKNKYRDVKNNYINMGKLTKKQKKLIQDIDTMRLL